MKITYFSIYWFSIILKLGHKLNQVDKCIHITLCIYPLRYKRLGIINKWQDFDGKLYNETNISILFININILGKLLIIN